MTADDEDIDSFRRSNDDTKLVFGDTDWANPNNLKSSAEDSKVAQIGESLLDDDDKNSTLLENTSKSGTDTLAEENAEDANEINAISFKDDVENIPLDNAENAKTKIFEVISFQDNIEESKSKDSYSVTGIVKNW